MRDELTLPLKDWMLDWGGSTVVHSEMTLHEQGLEQTLIESTEDNS